jgi:hypothetical protein
MRKLTVRFAVLSLTFSAGVAAFLLCGHLRAVEDVPAPLLRPAAPEGWQKVEAGGRFSFYAPPDMRAVELSCHLSDKDGGGLSANRSVLLDYGYGERLPCGLPLGHPDTATRQTFDVEVGGRAAKLQKSAEGDRAQMCLCFPDDGDGRTTISLRVAYGDARGAEVAGRIFDSVEFK